MTDLMRRLTEADPTASVVMRPLPAEAVKALARESVMRSDSERIDARATAPDVRAERQRRRKRRVVVAALAAGVITVPAAAVASYSAMRSGLFGSGGEEVAGEEKLYTDAPEIRDVVRELTEEFPLPPGATYDEVLRRYPTSERALTQRTALGQEVQFAAACSWYQDWQTAPHRRATDQQTIDAVPSWRYWRFPSGDAGPEMLRRIAAETRTGSSPTLMQFVRANC